jgi:hypothetical protein
LNFSLIANNRLRGKLRNLWLLYVWLNRLAAALDSGSLRLCLKNPQGDNPLDLYHARLKR